MLSQPHRLEMTGSIQGGLSLHDWPASPPDGRYLRFHESGAALWILRCRPALS